MGSVENHRSQESHSQSTTTTRPDSSVDSSVSSIISGFSEHGRQASSLLQQLTSAILQLNVLWDEMLSHQEDRRRKDGGDDD